MDKKTAQLALAFLQRIQVKGSEVVAYVQVQNALAAIANRVELVEDSRAPKGQEAG